MSRITRSIKRLLGMKSKPRNEEDLNLESMSNIKKSVNIRFRHISIKTLNRVFPLFQGISGGGKLRVQRTYMIVQTINQIFPFLSSLATDVTGRKLELIKTIDFPRAPEEKKSASELKKLFDRHGSDKSSHHSYHNVYGVILKDGDAVTRIFEIGLGTNNQDVVSNMGALGRPGASLRAFRDYCPNAEVYGADVDRRVLFREDRIKTYYVDQTDVATFADLSGVILNDFDLMIDDGLHSPNANIASLRFFLPKLKVGGWAVIEDIGRAAIPVWEVVAALLPDSYSSHLLDDGGAILFAVQRLR